MKAKYITIDKQSKRNRKNHFASKRGSWGNVNPVTKVIPNDRIYKREKIKGQKEL